MAESLEQLAKSAGALNGVIFAPRAGTSPLDSGLNPQYGRSWAQNYANDMGAAASDCYDAESQGLDKADFYNYIPVKIRSAFATTGISGELMPDDWQRVHIIAPARYTNIGQGAYMKYAGNTWIVYKPRNMSATLGQAIVRRCNAVINVLDWYGNIVSVPMSYAKMNTLGNASSSNDNSILAKNYISVICQKNEHSADFRENTRFILGQAAYAMRGMNDFTREYTDDPDSVHILSFTIERTEPLPQDNMELQVADYDSFKWDIGLTAQAEMNVGATQTISVISRRNGVSVATSEEHPISYYFTSSDEDVLTVDDSGFVTAIGEGSATITAVLDQNNAISESIDISVAAAGSSGVIFTLEPPAILGEGESATVTAAVLQDGVASSDIVTWSFAGAPESAYSAEIDGNSITLTAYAASPVPLTITASYGDSGAVGDIILTI